MTASFTLELLCEEMPARLQVAAAIQLGERLAALLTAHGVNDAAIETWAAPRRLGARAPALPGRTAARTLEKKGPRVDGPAPPLQGFLAANNVRQEDLATRHTDKGDFYFLQQTVPSRPMAEVLAEGVAGILLAFSWPKSMRWGSHAFRWVRPLRRVAATLDGRPLPGGFFLGGTDAPPGYAPAGGKGVLPYQAHTLGHRLLSPGECKAEALERHHVLADSRRRRDTIVSQGDRLAAEKNLEVEYPPTLLDEVAGLVEWPVAVLGRIEPRFMDLPAEVLMTSMRVHQKYFPCFEQASGQLAPYFLTVANQPGEDGGIAIALGNEKVLRARLFDAAFFWSQDRRQPLESWNKKLDTVVFHARAGSVGDKARRVEALARSLAAEILGADAALAARAARLCKSDLVSGIVGEFPELQGVMGGYYAEEQNEPPEVALAIREHYQPLGPSQPPPTAPVSVAVALADKLDSLSTLFAAGEAPTGSKDPFALRRLAYGIMRIILENNLDLDVFAYLEAPEVRTFLLERAQQYLKDKGGDGNTLRAVFAAAGDGRLTRLSRKAAALAAFLRLLEAEELRRHYSRASNIVRIEEKKDGVSYQESAVDAALLAEPAEVALSEAIADFEARVHAALTAQDYLAACEALRPLGAPLAAFFDQVTVNVPQPELRRNRLRLLGKVRAALRRLADFDQLQG